ncbi:MAG TPA: hypothetical protein VHS31_00070 [Tepidisphaeraceae bacterium]|jgi:hypothetical protein|nr:hypothetical protein [Tepidisphaeraceae bacterium]
MNHRTRTKILAPIVLGLALCITGCGSKIDGKYIGAGNMVTIELKSGKATITDSSAGTTETDDYTVDGDKITIKAKQGDLLLTRMQDGTLSAPYPLGDFKKSAG